MLLGAGYVATLIAIAFWPTPIDRPITGALSKSIDLLHRRGLPNFIGYKDIEFMANVLLFIPVGGIIATWNNNLGRTIVFATYASLSIELVQELTLPQRFATVMDIVANTIGAAIGGVVFPTLLAWRSQWRMQKVREISND